MSVFLRRGSTDLMIRTAVSIAVLFSLGWGYPALAATFTTECPEAHPNKPDKKFKSAAIRHTIAGSWAAGDHEMILESGDEHWIERHPKDKLWFHRAFLSCFYSPYSEKLELLLPVPGVLREYHVVYRNVGSGSSREAIFIRAWAVSADDPLSEAPPGKLIPPE